MTFLSSRVRKLILLVSILFAFLLAYRIVFWAMFAPSPMTFSFGDAAMAFYLGIKFDLRLVLVLAIPALLFGAIPKVGFGRGNRRADMTWTILYGLLHAGILIVYAADVGAFAYLATRANSTLLKLLESPDIAATMVWQSYPVVRGGLLLALLLGAHIWVLRRWVFTDIRPSVRRWTRSVPMWTLLGLFWAFGIYGKMGYYPLRWSEAYFSPNSFLSQFALNPVTFLVDTWSFREGALDLKKVRENYDVVARFLRVDHPDATSLRFDRQFSGHPVEGKRPNIVYIVLESMAAYKSGLFGNLEQATPYLDAIAHESRSYSRFYVPSQATARSIFASVSGVPDVSQEKTGSRNPFMANQHSIMNEFQGYQKFYFLGGSANWGNIRALFTHNVDGIRIYEEGSYSSPRSDVWGISDLDLMTEAHQVLEKEKGPFFAYIQTAGFHRPYTIPPQHGEYTTTTLKGGKRASGFSCEEELNSLRFQDYALGHFFALAKKSAYYRDTIFVIHGDHGLPHDGAENVPLGDRLHDLENFHTPLVFHGPRFFKPERRNQWASEVDVLPTLAGVAGIPYRTRSLGRDLNDPEVLKRQQLFTFYWYNHPQNFGVLDGDFYYVGDASGAHSLYRYRTTDYAKDVCATFPDQCRALHALGQGLYFTSRYLLYNNPRF